MNHLSFRRNHFLQTLLVLYAILWVLLSLNPYDIFSWWLENALTLLALLVLIPGYKHFQFSNTAYACIFLFLLLHTYGAHYSYTTTPLDKWIRLLLHTNRDDYDRLVHFSFGFFLVIPVFEYVRRFVQAPQLWRMVIAVSLIFSAGAFYELIEMWVANTVAPDIGLRFVGFQGDIWDAQKDMELALFGAIIMMVARSLTRRQK
jgi:putative membrane protein